MNKVIAKAKEEALAMLPPTIFFFIALHVIALVRVLISHGTGIAPSSTISIAVASLILGKAVLIADMLPLINRYPERPLIYNVAWKTMIYLVMSALIWSDSSTSGGRRAVSSRAMRSCSRKSTGRISWRYSSFCSC